MAIVFVSLSLPVAAYDFEVDGLAYTITSLTDLTVSVSVDTLKNKGVTHVRIPPNVEYKGKTLTVTDISKNGFNSISTLVEVNIPNTIINIRESAFEDCSALIKITIPSSVQNIESYAFYGCSALVAISIPTELKEISKGTFYGCASLKSVELPNSIQSIETGAFMRCISLKSIVLPNGIQSIGTNAFRESGIETIDIPETVTKLGDGVFRSCPLEEVELPSSINAIPPYCFYNCQNLANITFSATIIGSYAFAYCDSLQEFNPSCKIVSIEGSAFDYCNNLKKFVIPSDVTSISHRILWYCPSVETLQIGSGLNELPTYYFPGYGTNYDIEFGSIGSSYIKHYYISKTSSSLYLESLKNLIIDDSEKSFAMNGFWFEDTKMPAFANLTLDYFYVGRPLVKIKDWKSSGYFFSVDKNIKQGYGRIKMLEISGCCDSIPFLYQKIDSLKLGKNIKTINLNNIYKSNLKQIQCLSNTPPQIVKGTFPTAVYTDAILYVPDGCKDLYAKSNVWKNFWDIREADSSSGVEYTDIANDHNKLIRVYNLYGILVKETRDMSDIQSLPKGLYIVNGKKIIVN